MISTMLLPPIPALQISQPKGTIGSASARRRRSIAALECLRIDDRLADYLPISWNSNAK